MHVQLQYSLFTICYFKQFKPYYYYEGTVYQTRVIYSQCFKVREPNRRFYKKKMFTQILHNLLTPHDPKEKRQTQFEIPSINKNICRYTSTSNKTNQNI